MTTIEKKHEVREHLAVISTEVYLLLKAASDNERIERYNIVQEEIDAILKVIEDAKPLSYSCSDNLTP